MSKSRKSRKVKRASVQFSPLTMLRPRLDALLSDAALAESVAPEVIERLEAVCADLPPDDFLPTLLRALDSALAPVQARLDEVVPTWLGARHGIEALHRLVQRHTLTPSGQNRALAWLQATGSDPVALQEFRQETPFYGAYRYADDSQGLINILWYTDGRRRHIQGLGFLIDYNPPWEGAIKDVLVAEPGSPERALRRYVHFWTDRGMPLQPVSDAAAKREVFECLAVNRREGIRLPHDLIVHRRLFVEHILSLSDTPETPPFTAEDFDALSRTGETVESLRRFEQQVGRRVRLEDGKEIIVMGDPFDEDDW
jgi:hypothetical protein